MTALWLFALTLPISSVGLAAGDWDVNDTGQPYTDAEFTLEEGTWMSVDVSPDGGTLAFDMLGDIYTLPAGGGDAVAVHAGPAMQVAPSFSSDGRRLLYLSDASGADNVWVSNVDGSAPRQVTHETMSMLAAPTWGPRDESVAAVRTQALYLQRDLPEICLFDLVGGNGRVLVPSPQPGRDVQEARFSPDGRFLYYTERVTTPTFVYVDANHMNYVIRRRELSTGDTEQVIGGFGGATTAQVSPDGKRIAFVRRVMSKTVLFVHDLASGTQRPVYDELDRDHQASYPQQGAYYPSFDWFPDNRHVAIWGKGELYRIDVDTAAAQQIAFRAHARHRITNSFRVEHDLAPEQFVVRTVRQLAPTNDGRSIVFTAVGHLWRKHLPNEPAVRLTRATAFEFEPTWSSDGRELVYVEWDDTRGSALKIMPASARVGRTVATSRGLMREPVFSPDGEWLVYRIQAGDKAMGGFRDKPGIYAVRTRGGGGHFVADGDEAPRFSADGRRIYFIAKQPANGLVPQVRTLLSVTVDGSDRREHAHTVDTDTLELRLSPDQRWIAFRERQQYYVMPYDEIGTPLIVSAAAEVVPVSRLTRLGGYSLTWSSDSASLHWTLGSSLYRAEVAKLAAMPAEQPQPYADIDLKLPTDVPQGTLAFTNARLITMRDEEVIERGTVVVTRNRIVAAGPAESVIVPKGAKTIDAAGKTIMPGLIDMHWHNFTDCCDRTGANPQKQPSRYAALAYGLTTNYDPYSTPQMAYEAGETTLAGITVSPRWISSGPVIYGRPQMTDASYVPIDSYDDARTAVTRQRLLGGTIIKSYRQPTRRQRQMLVKAAREVGIMVDVEGEGQFYRNLSEILDGHTDLQHNLPLANYYDDVVQLMKHGTTPNTPVLLIIYGELFGENYLYQTRPMWNDPKIRAYVPEIQASAYSPVNVPAAAPPYARGMTGIHVADDKLWDVGFRAVSRSMKKLDDAGVIVNAGSHGAVPGLGLHWEMWLLAEGGMRNHRVLRAATINGARTLGLDRQIGSLEPGKLADLIVLDANPLQDIHNTDTVRYTMVNGRLYDSLSMNEIGNYDRPRDKFYWELDDHHGIDWNESWTGQ